VQIKAGIRPARTKVEPWWVLADVCRVLKIGNPSQAAVRLDDDEKHTLTTDEGDKIKGLGSVGSMPTLINESGLNKAIMTSRKPAARRFTKWVTSEFIPAIRRTGSYSLPSAQQYPSLTTEDRRWETRCSQHIRITWHPAWWVLQ
jgi:prophage antirepressor-like protein